MAKGKNPLTEKEAAYIVHWFQDNMKLTDWTISVCCKESPPDWVGDHNEDVVGNCVSELEFKTAYIWVASESSWDHLLDPRGTLIHELCHVMADDAGITDSGTPQLECVWNSLADVLLRVYETDRKKDERDKKKRSKK